MKRETKIAIKTGLNIFIIPFVIGMVFLILSALFGCSTERMTEPMQDGISGVYQSVAYQGIETYSVKMEIIQKGSDVTGIMEIDGRSYSVYGYLKNYHLELRSHNGVMQVDVDQKGTYYPLAGALTWQGEMRAIRFELLEPLHDQGGTL